MIEAHYTLEGFKVLSYEPNLYTAKDKKCEQYFPERKWNRQI